MSAIGRIFLVLNLILSALFVGWASNYLNQSEEWRGKYDGKVSELVETTQKLNEEADALQAKLDAATARLATAESQRDGFERQAADRQTELDTERGRAASLQGDVTTMTNSLSDLNTTLSTLEDAKDAAVAEARQAQSERDDAVAARMDADAARTEIEDQLDKAGLRIVDLETALTSTQSMLSRKDAQLATIVDEYNIDLKKLLDQPLIEAAVLSVKNSDGFSLVALNVGSDDKVERGMTFQIWSGGQYKGEVRVDSVMPGMCSALVTTAVDGTSISEGDNAATRL
jgi:predicted  nucleic acid-binding Zn-ribbon protein